MALVILILGLVLFVLLVVLHEFGHALAARRKGVEVEEFGIGFPPRAWKRKLKSGTVFSLNWLPLGGFVKLKGEHDSATGPGTYGAASLLTKVQILLAGVVVNWVVAALIFTILALVGLPQLLPDQFTVPADTKTVKSEVLASAVVANSPAQKAGLKSGDTILAANNQELGTARELVDFTAKHAGQRVKLKVKSKDNNIKDILVKLNQKRLDDQGYAGIVPGEFVLRRSTWSAPIVGIGVTAQLTAATADGLVTTVGYLFKQQFNQAGQNVAGPVGIFNVLKSSSEIGLIPVLFLIGIISLTLSVMNILPIPALDGGRLFITLLFRILSRPLTKEREEAIQAVGFGLLILLVVVITASDIIRM